MLARKRVPARTRERACTCVRTRSRAPALARRCPLLSLSLKALLWACSRSAGRMREQCGGIERRRDSANALAKRASRSKLRSTFTARRSPATEPLCARCKMSSGDPHALHTFMAQVTDEMASEYQRIYSKSSEDPGTAGDEGEGNWAELFTDWLPPQYHVRTKGRMIATDGRMSPQVDVLVLKPSYPRKLLEKKIWLADGVVAAFECKNTLKAADVAASVHRCATFKGLCRSVSGTPRRDLVSPLIYGLLAHSHVWKGEHSTPIDNVMNNYDTAGSSIKSPKDLIDVICVADLANWSAMKMTCYQASYLEGEKADELRRFFGGEYGPTSAMVCASPASEGQKDTFRPISALLAYVTDMIAWQDPSVRDIAQYYRGANMWGSGAGPMRFWPSSNLSVESKAGIAAGMLKNGAFWSDWSVAH